MSWAPRDDFLPYGFGNPSARLLSRSMASKPVLPLTDPRFRGDLLITDHIGLDDLVGTGYQGC